MSFAIATSILRSVAACCASLESNWSRSSLVTPSTMAATSGPNSLLQVLVGDGGVLDRVVEQRGCDRDVVETEVGEDHRHPERVRDVRLAGAAHLVGVGDPGDLEGLLDQCGVALAVPVAVGGDERRDFDVDVVSTPGQDRAPVGSYLDPRLGITHDPRVVAGVSPTCACAAAADGDGALACSAVYSPWGRR